ncbi:hypothetical protein CH333_03895 [candidate division WOR-3 bacterium JGI_Cruoil_03_44_89]|uniref:PAS domain S-box protein n=1 Tax=candidate division WOR-3 bacterium JGI_Cruoil_03_44_89 TaxID=1973748 RepID=A0A235BV06_UNCW3|nr:MAG: hypothetical protein CH333_03895 [candidate division WOR-3 bacterium JGI_Cruoil_03_44_89]
MYKQSEIIRVLLVEDDPGETELIRDMLSGPGEVTFDLECVDRLSKGLECLAAGGIDVVLLDLGLPYSQGLDTFTMVYARAPEVPIVVLTGINDVTLAIKAVREGAQDYLVKSQVESKLLVRSLHYAIERKRAEEIIRKSEAMYRSLYETTLALAKQTDLDTVIRTISDRATAFLEANDCAVYLLDQKRKVLVPIFSNASQGREEIMANEISLGEGLSGRVAKMGAGAYINAGDETNYAVHIPGIDEVEDKNESVICVPVFDGSKVIGVITIGKLGARFDKREVKKLTIFARQAEIALKRAQNLQALRESEEKSRTLVEMLEEGIGTVDEKENFVFINQAAADIFGYSKEELLGKNLGGSTTPEKFKQVLGQTSIGKSGQASQYELAITRKDGEARIISVTSTPIMGDNGKYRGAFGIFHDITERKRTEEELRKRLAQLEIYYQSTLGREKRIIALKREVNELLGELGREEKYGV